MIYKKYKIINHNLQGGNINKILQNSNTFIKYDTYEEESNILCPRNKPFLCTINSKNTD